MNTRGGDSADQDTDSSTAVEFVFRRTVADFEEALRARARRTPAGRIQVLMPSLGTIAAVAVAATLQHATLPVWIVALVLGVVAAFWATVRGFRTMARRMSSIMEPYGQCRMVADDRGMVITGERASFTADWTAFGEYLETPNVFVLLGGDRATGVTVLPKSGAQDHADVDQLRAILDHNLKRR